MNRIQSTLINSIASIANMIITYLAMFLYRTALIKILGNEYVGVTGLFGNIISIFSLVELGIGTAITVKLYQPLAENNQKKIAAYMNSFKKIYRIIAIIIMILGIILVPFLGRILGENSIEHMYFIYFLYLINTVLSYMFFAYYQILIMADRKDYKMFFSKSIIPVLISVFQIIAIVVYREFILTILINMIFTIIGNIWVAYIANKLYPFLKTYKYEYISKKDKIEVIDYVKATAYYKVAMNVLYSSDNIIVSYFLGLTTLGIYSNYCLIINTVKALILSIVHPVGAAIGNLNVTTETSYKKLILDRLTFINNWICYFCTICFFVLINPFIELWIGEGYILDNYTLIIIIVNFYTEFMPNFIVKYRNSCGLDIYGRFRPIITAILNIIFSILFVKYLGLFGILLGTLLSRLLTVFWFDPYIVYKKLFNELPIQYFITYSKNTILTVLSSLICNQIFSTIWKHDLFSFILGMIICFIVSNVIFIFINIKNRHFIYYVSLLKAIKNKTFNMN